MNPPNRKRGRDEISGGEADEEHDEQKVQAEASSDPDSPRRPDPPTANAPSREEGRVPGKHLDECVVF